MGADVMKNMKAAIMVSVNTKPTKAAINAKKLMEGKRKVIPRVIMKERSHNDPKFEVYKRGGISYVRETEGTNETLYVPVVKTVEDLLEELKKAQDVGKVIANELIEVEKGGEGLYKSGDVVNTILGTFTIVEVEDDEVTLLDQNNELLSMTLEDLEGLLEEEDVSEVTQVSDIETPVADLTGQYRAIYKRISPTGIVEELTVSADDRKELDITCSEIEKDENFVEWVDFVGVEDEEDVFGYLDDEEDEIVKKLVKNEEKYIVGQEYRTDLGVVLIEDYQDGEYLVSVDGEKISLTEEDLDDIEPIEL